MTEVSTNLRNLFDSSSSSSFILTNAREVQVGYLAQCTRILILVLFFFFFFFFSFSFSFFFRCTRLPHTRLLYRTCKTSWGGITAQHVQDRVRKWGYAFSLFFSLSICIFNVFYFSFSFFVFSFFFLFQVYTASAYTASTQNVQDQLGQNSSVHGFRAHGFHTERARLAGVEFQHSTCKTRVHYLFIN